ncbi:MAG: carbamoyltransferase HypF, partial [Planctomycetota bacterium]
MSLSRGKAIRVDGIVQGVGFRPFVYGLATRLGLVGDVRNDTRGVLIRVFGPTSIIDNFIDQLQSDPPPLAEIDDLAMEDLPAEDHDGFVIVESQTDSRPTVGVTPDAATCDDCLRELLDEQDRRYRYPFINCTHCGPRYSIIEQVPYDRPNTTMRDFGMCDRCRAEYTDPGDRRYHAQPVCCPACGPRLAWLDESGRAVEGDPLVLATEALQAGRVVAIKGLGGFHLACDATRPEAVARLRRRKLREEKPLAVMVRDIAHAGRLVELPPYAEKLLGGPVAPIVLAPRKHPTGLAPEVAPVNEMLGVMLAYTPLHVLLFEQGLDVLVMTSANRSDEPIVIDNDEARQRLAGIAEGYLVHNRRINVRLDDSVVLATPRVPTVIRRARGYAPGGIEVDRRVDGILAFGPQMKNTPAVGRGTRIYPGQHIGDLENTLAVSMFHEVVDHLQHILDVHPTLGACDLHPDYTSTRLAERSGLPLVRVQHHHAHVVSVMAEKQLDRRCIGVALDGTGWGDDGAIWGGEVFSFDAAGYRRVLHLEYVKLPGGDRAIRQPWRTALAHLHHAGLHPSPFMDHDGAETVWQLLDSSIDQPQTSSMGRLFDAVASLCGVCHENTFEGKAAMSLEGALETTTRHYPVEIDDGVIKVGPMIA